MYSSLMDGEVYATRLCIDAYIDLIIHNVTCIYPVNIGYFVLGKIQKKNS